MRKRPEIPEDVFFDTTPESAEPEVDPEPDEQPEAPAEPEPAAENDLLAKSMDDRDGPVTIKLSEVRAERARKRAEQERGGAAEESGSRVGRPPAQEGPKVAVTLYLTEPVAHRLEEVKFLLLTEYDVKTSKSAIADFALRHGLDDLQAAADDLRRD